MCQNKSHFMPPKAFLGSRQKDLCGTLMYKLSNTLSDALFASISRNFKIDSHGAIVYSMQYL